VIAYVCDTLIFVLSGLVMGEFFAKSLNDYDYW